MINPNVIMKSNCTDEIQIKSENPDLHYQSKWNHEIQLHT